MVVEHGERGAHAELTILYGQAVSGDEEDETVGLELTFFHGLMCKQKQTCFPHIKLEWRSKMLFNMKK